MKNKAKSKAQFSVSSNFLIPVPYIRNIFFEKMVRRSSIQEQSKIYFSVSGTFESLHFWRERYLAGGRRNHSGAKSGDGAQLLRRIR